MDRGHRGRSCDRKRIFQTAEEAQQAITDLGSGVKGHPSRVARISPYYCRRHACWHIGCEPTEARRKRLAKKAARRAA